MHAASFSFGATLALAFLFIGFALFAAIAALSHSRERAFSAAIIYLVLGVAAGLVVRYADLGRLAHPVRDHGVLETATDWALVVGLFATGMRIRRRPTLGGWNGALRLVGVAMPAMVALVALWAWGLGGLAAGAAIALGAALAPTDPVLAGDLGVDAPEAEDEERAPEPEFVLSAEAGLNDGLGTPFLLLGIAVARGDSLARWAGINLVYSVLAAVALGAALGYLIARASAALRERGLLRHDFDRWVGFASAFLVFGAAEAAGAYGFVAVFVAGVAFRRQELEGAYRREVHDGADVLKHFAELAVILILGSMLAFGGFSEAGVWGLALAPVAILVLRPLTALAALVRAPRLAFRERLWVAWFGVKGVASLNYVALAAASGAFGRDGSRLAWTVLWCVALSIVVHGVSSASVTRRLLTEPRRRDAGRERQLELLPDAAPSS